MRDALIRASTTGTTARSGRLECRADGHNKYYQACIGVDPNSGSFVGWVQYGTIGTSEEPGGSRHPYYLGSDICECVEILNTKIESRLSRRKSPHVLSWKNKSGQQDDKGFFDIDLVYKSLIATIPA